METIIEIEGHDITVDYDICDFSESTIINSLKPDTYLETEFYKMLFDVYHKYEDFENEVIEKIDQEIKLRSEENF